MSNNFPKIRFQDFSEPWVKLPLVSFVDRIKRKNTKLESKLPLTISAKYGLVDQTTFFNKVVASNSISGYYLLIKGDFAYNKSYSKDYPYGAIKRLNLYDKGIVSTLYICFKPKEKISSDFVEHYFESDKWYKVVSDIAREGARNHGLLNVGVNDFFETLHYVPKIEEQTKIANFFNILDERIKTQEIIVEKFTNVKNNFLNYLIDNCEEMFEEILLSDLLTETKEKNKQSDLEICSVAVEEGIVNQIEHLGKSLAAKNVSNYKVVHYGDVVYTKSPTGSFPYGIVKQSWNEEDVAISPLYATFQPNSFETGLYIHYYFLNHINANNYLDPLVEKGAKNTINVSNKKAISGTIMFPRLEYLNKICDYLETIDERYHHEKRILEKYLSQKKHFLKNMFC